MNDVKAVLRVFRNFFGNYQNKVMITDLIKSKYVLKQCQKEKRFMS